MKVGVIGAVGTTALTIEMLLIHGFKIVGVLGQEPKNIGKVSGLQNLRGLSNNLNLDFQGFQIIEKDDHFNWMKEKSPEIIFAVGFSQLLSERWLELAPYGCVGFHPTKLPEGRGRAPIAWMLLEKRGGAASFFKMGKGADDGPIFVQYPFEVDDDDDVESLMPKVQNAIRVALNNWLPKLKKGIIEITEQDHSLATVYGKREPIDGFINWNKSAYEIDRLVKASAKPYPGAFSFFKGEIIKILKSEFITNFNQKGVIGRILYIDLDGSFFIQCGIGILKVNKFDKKSLKELKVGDLLGGVIPFDKIDEINSILIK